MSTPLQYSAVLIVLVVLVLFFFYPSMLWSKPETTSPAVTAAHHPRAPDAAIIRALESSPPKRTQPPSRRQTNQNQALSPWGYNANRNVPRWNALYKSVQGDVESRGSSSFSLVDYGADQGYFSISFANFFRNATIMGIEAGGSGGIIGKKSTTDVLQIQEKYIAKLKLTNMQICQARVHQDMFDKLNEAHAVVDYQLVLSVFHWFQLPNRTAFEYSLVQLLRNAKTTFLELPTLGDDGPKIRGQVGYKFFKIWYDGRSDIEKIIQEATVAHGLSVKITKILQAKWSHYTRSVYRVDVEQSEAQPDGDMFECVARRKIYDCAEREKHSQCSA